GALVEAVERRLDDPGVLPRLDLLPQLIALGATGDVDERGQPVQRCKHFGPDLPWFDVPGPADDQRTAVATLPGLAFLPFEGRDAAIGEANCLSTIVSSEDNDGVVELSHVLKLLKNIANIIVQL